jgi:hypothetical protein
MKTNFLLLTAAAFLFAACDAQVNVPPAENYTTVVTPAEKEVEHNTTIVNPPATEKKTESTTVTTPGGTTTQKTETSR